MKPSFEVDLGFVNASYQSPYGKIESRWEKGNGQLTWEVAVPANAQAILYIPAEAVNDVKEGNKLASESDCVQFLRMENGKAVFEIGSGRYSFSVKNKSMSKK